MDDDMRERIALHRYGVIAEALSARLTKAERGATVREIAGRTHTHPDGTQRRYSRGTIDRWVRSWKESGLDALRPDPRADIGAVRGHPELIDEVCRLRLEKPSRSAAQIARMITFHHGVRVAERTVRDQLRRRGLHRAALTAERRLFGRYEAERSNERWVTDVLIGCWVPHPRTESSVRAKLFLIVDDHSRLLVDGVFYAHENARNCQDILRRAITHRGVPEVLYADNGAPFKNAWLTRTCAVLGIRLVHSKPYAPQGRGKQERLNRFVRESFLAEAEHRGIESLEELNDLFCAWVAQVANRRVHKETNETPIARFEADGPHRQAPPERMKEAFRWSAMRKVAKTATVSLEGNAYAVDPSLVGRRVELRYVPEDLTEIVVYFEGRPVGSATPFVVSRHVHHAVPQADAPAVEETGIDFLEMVAKAHEEEAGTGDKPRFRELQLFAADEDDEEAQR